MVDEDKQACRLLADSDFRGGQWPESYVTWEFLEKHPKAMEPGYVSLNWNHIPGLFHQKEYMCTMVIPRADLQRLCDPAQLKEFWEPTEDPASFHTTLALVFVRDVFHDCDNKSRRNDLEVSVAVVHKPAHLSAMTFSAAAIELLDLAEQTPTLLIVWLHTGSPLFPDCYYHHNRKHFLLIHDTGEDYCYGHSLRFVSAELLSKYEPGKNYSPRAKLSPSWRRNPGITFLVDSCV